jgi:hypothetical protein
MRERVMLHLVAAAVTIFVLAPLAAPGYVLSYDMVFVPHQPLRWDLIAPTTTLPRAVPQDAMVSMLSQVVPGWLLQRIVLVGAIYLAAIGAGRLVPARRRLTRAVAAIGYAWSPYLAERLLLGHWGLLLAYAALPWLVRAAIGVRTGRPGALPRLVLAGAAAAMTPTGGIVALVVTAVLISGAGVAAPRSAALGIGAIALLNGPWLAATMVTGAGTGTDPAGVAAFAARGENWSGALGALAGTGGIWNAQTTPGSRASPLVPLVTGALVLLAVVGFGALGTRWPRGVAARLAWLAGGALAVAAVGTFAPGAAALRWMVTALPGAGLLRDGQKFLMPYALLLVLGAALGAEELAVRLAQPRARAVLLAVLVLPVATMPDLAAAGWGRLRPVSFPRDWDEVAAHIGRFPGEVLSLPFAEYHAYSWNGWRPVIDPAARYLPARVLIDDTLRIGLGSSGGELVVAGEDTRAAEVRGLLVAGVPVAQADVRWVVVQRDSGTVLPERTLEGLQLVYSGQSLVLYWNPTDANPGSSDTRGRWLVVTGYLVAVLVVIAAGWRMRPVDTAW